MSESVSSLPKEHHHTEHEANEPHTADLEATEHQATDHQEEAVDTSWVCGHCQIYNHSTSLQCVNCQQNKDQVLIQQAHHEAHHAEVQDHAGVSPPAGGEIQQPENNGMAASHWMPGPGAPLPHLEMMPNAGPHDGTWSCTKCGRANLETKARCSSCQGWKNGERQNMGRKKDPDSGIPLES